MTIKELENRTGMARANIRFYEEEGLLSPKRLANGYRDYSEEDVGTLEKIRLLRQLQLDIDTIRRVQQGALTLEQALFVQQTKLEGDRAVIERAAQVCRELERSGVEYAALEPRPWLQQLEAPQEPRREELPAPGPSPARERDNEPRACYHPWMRYFARGLDMALYNTILNAAYLLLTRDQSLVRISTTLTGGLICGAVLLALTLALEPLWIHYWGWTPGKWLFGLKLRDGDGTKLSIAQARERCWELAWQGYGWNIPIWRLWRMWQGRVSGLEGGDCPWDGEEGYRYTKVERRFSVPVYVAARAALAGLLVLAGLWSLLPPCRGDLTVAEFARNYNHFNAQLGWEAPRLGKDGRWTEPADGDGQGGTIGMEVDGVWVELEAPVWDGPEFTLEDGRVTAVTLRVSGGCLGAAPDVLREQLAILALSGATGHWSLLKPNVDGWLKMGLEALGGRAGEAEARQWGLRVAAEEELSGYREEEAAYGSLTPIVGEEQRYERIVTISLEE